MKQIILKGVVHEPEPKGKLGQIVVAALLGGAAGIILMAIREIALKQF